MGSEAASAENDGATFAQLAEQEQQTGVVYDRLLAANPLAQAFCQFWRADSRAAAGERSHSAAQLRPCATPDNEDALAQTCVAAQRSALENDTPEALALYLFLEHGLRDLHSPSGGSRAALPEFAGAWALVEALYAKTRPRLGLQGAPLLSPTYLDAVGARIAGVLAPEHVAPALLAWVAGAAAPTAELAAWLRWHGLPVQTDLCTVLTEVRGSLVSEWTLRKRCPETPTSGVLALAAALHCLV
jgi:hypothetical protein